MLKQIVNEDALRAGWVINFACNRYICDGPGEASGKAGGNDCSLGKWTWWGCELSGRGIWSRARGKWPDIYNKFKNETR